MESGFVHIEASVAGRDGHLGREIVFAQTSKERRAGLRGRKSLGNGTGFWLNPCEAIHTFGMSFPIDVLFLDGNFRVRKIRSALAPRRIAFCLRAESTLELPAGLLQARGIQVGDRLEIRRSN